MIKKIQLNVRASNSSAIYLYKKFGFQEEGRLKNRVKIQDRYIDDLIMGLDLLYKPEISDVVIQVMEKDDVDLLVKIFCFPWSSPQTTTEKWDRYYAEHQKRTRTVYLLKREGQIIGYGSLLRLSEYPKFWNAGIPEANDVWISEEWRNKGLGKMLILHLENIARKEGYKQIGLGVGLYRDYGPAQNLYVKQGYVPDGEGITYKTAPAIPGEQYPIDDDPILWLIKPLN